MKRHIVITGTRRGLGQALAQELRERGHVVAGCSGNSPPPEQVDVGDAQQVEQWAQKLLQQWGRPPDLLINNAAITTRPDPLWAQDPQDMAQILRINVAGIQHVIRAFVPSMLEQARGIIINISSDWGRSAAPMVAPYCTSKWAVEGMTACLALELPRGMAAIALDPGTINTDMLRFTFGPGAEHYPSPEQWRKKAAEFVLSLGPQHNGKALSIPD